MPTSAPGSRSSGRPGNRAGTRPGRRRQARASAGRRAAARHQGGFTLIELMIVVAITVIAAGAIALSMRDSDEARLEEEAARFAALLEMARAEARVAGTPVQWVPAGLEAAAAPGEAGPRHFRFVGLLAEQALPVRWLDARTRAEIVGAAALQLGPEAILPPQRVLLRLGERRLEVASDGLEPFAVRAPAVSPP